MQRKRANPDFKANEAAKVQRSRKNRGAAYLQRVREFRKAAKEWVDSFKHKCARCPETHLACLDFHHRDPKNKRFLISVNYARYTKETLATEIAKCDIICANCHRKLHYDERLEHAA